MFCVIIHAMALTDDDVRHIAKLARLQLKDEEVSVYAKELSAILDYIGMLQNADTKNVEPASQITGLKNSDREDAVEQDGPDRDALLGTSPLPIVDHQIQTPSAHG